MAKKKKVTNNGVSLEQVALGLIEKWNTENRQDPPDIERVTSTLKLLQTMGLFTLNPEIGLAITAATAAIKLFQQRDRRPFRDGFLSGNLIKRIFSAPDCPDREDHDESGVRPVADGANADQYTIRYFVHPSVPETIGREDTDDLIADAFAMWTQVTKFLIVDGVDSEADANVIVKCELIDGVGNVVGRAPVAGPGNFNNLTIVMDKKEDWNAQLFLLSVCHEIGHVLGLGHSSHSDQVMSPIVPEYLTSLGSEDVGRVQTIFGASTAEDSRPPVHDRWRFSSRRRNRNR